MNNRLASRRRAGVASGFTALLLAAAPLVALAPSAQAATPTPFSRADVFGYTTGTALHSGVINTGDMTVVNVEDAFSGASVGTKGLNRQIVNEMGIEVQPRLPVSGQASLSGNRSYARGSGLEAGLGNPIPTVENQLELQKIRVSAPPSRSESDEVIGLPDNPLLAASVLRGSATANWAADGSCILGKPISEGRGYAADVEVAPGDSAPLSTDSDAADESRSFTQLVPQVNKAGKTLGNAIGLLAETRQVIAPVRLLEGTPGQIEITVAGVWVLQAVAGGIPGTAFTRYAPEGLTDPATPVVTVKVGLAPAQTTVAQVTLQDVLGEEGVDLNLPIGRLRIGTPAHRIGNFDAAPIAAADGTHAAAAVDVVSLTGLPGGLAEVRLGHMESEARVPAGGIDCPLPVRKTVDNDPVQPGEEFTYSITVVNPYDCTLTKVRVVDTITATEGVTWQVLGATPKADRLTNTLVEWKDVGPIGPKSSKVLRIRIRVDDSSQAGRFTDTATATALCGSGSGGGGNDVIVPLDGRTRVTIPEVGAPPEGRLPRTGEGALLPLAGLLLAVGAGALMRRRFAA